MTIPIGGYNLLGGGNHGPHRATSTPSHGNSVNQSGVANQGTYTQFTAPPGAWTQYDPLTQTYITVQNPGSSAVQIGYQTAQQIVNAGLTQIGWSTIGSTGHFGPTAAAYPKVKLPHEVTAGEIIAWRCWRVAEGWLRSVYMDTFWGCHETMEGNPDTDGVHAWKKMRDAIEYGLVGGVHGAGMKIIIGTVVLWGDVIEHEIGYRAQFARIKSLDHSANDSVTKEELQELRRKYLA